jgi:uncharacterized protein (TIGR00661 family)
MNILFGIVGDGMGHAMRSSVIIRKLLRNGHDVHVVSYGDPVDYLREEFPDVTEIWGLETITEGNEVSLSGTVLHNAHRGLLELGLPKNTKKIFELAADFEPDVVFSDFELWSWFFAKYQQVPFVTIANHYAMTRCSYPDAIERGFESEFRTTKNTIDWRVPSADHYLAPAFHRPERVADDTTIVPPVLRPAILDAEPEDGDHLIAYQTSYTDWNFARELRKLDRPVRAYGIRDVDESEREGNLLHRPFSEDQFIDDLATSAGVIGSPGFKLISECLHLGKPYFAIPIEGQGELIFNARYLDYLDYGDYDFHPDAKSLERFVGQLDRYRASLEDYDRRDNTRMFHRIHLLMEQYAPASEPLLAN